MVTVEGAKKTTVNYKQKQQQKYHNLVTNFYRPASMYNMYKKVQ